MSENVSNVSDGHALHNLHAVDGTELGAVSGQLVQLVVDEGNAFKMGAAVVNTV